MFLPLTSMLEPNFSKLHLQIVMLAELTLLNLKRACLASDLSVLLPMLIGNHRMHHAIIVASYVLDFFDTEL